MNIAIVGTGFVADYYMTTLGNYPGLRLAGVFDRSAARLDQFAAFHKLRKYDSLAAVMADPLVKIVVNLTTPESHFEVSRATLEAGKHVYCEKPLAMDLSDAARIVDLAEAKNLTVATAPANALSEAHGLAAAALAEGRIGTPRLVYAEMEDGPVFRDKWPSWRSRSGAPWPGLHEFEIGCTLEHSGYALSWLVSLFGAVDSLTAYSAVTFPNKGPGTENITMAPDFSVGCLNFRSGLVARLTSGLAAPKDRSLTILGDKGSITVRDLWDNRSAVFVEETAAPRRLSTRVVNRLEAKLGRFIPWKPTPGRRIAYPAATRETLPNFPSQIDFCRGIAAQAIAIEAGEQPFFSGRRALHITELALALNNAHVLPQPYKVSSGF
ncbi:Gfo/Idh/MocA family protein [Mesorhizobium sp. IMUNJ 23232]|uniref:Gfo/Idh/MocA family protein n=1 Tax=Mesorhizobium sp. IMUNJ 23232 TaxID=3376064 RepID=UPI0037A64DC5